MILIKVWECYFLMFWHNWKELLKQQLHIIIRNTIQIKKVVCYYVGVRNENVHLISHLVKKLNFLRNNKSNSIIKHYSTTKDNIPFWIVINFFSFGEMSRFYLILEHRIQNKIMSHFRNLYKKEYYVLPNLNNNFIKTFLRVSSLLEI